MNTFNDRILLLLQTKKDFELIKSISSLIEEAQSDLKTVLGAGHLFAESITNIKKMNDAEPIDLIMRQLVIIICLAYQSLYNLGILVQFAAIGNRDIAKNANSLLQAYCSLKHDDDYKHIITEQAKSYPIIGQPCFCNGEYMGRDKDQKPLKFNMF